jgi:hypothetical protein
VDEQLRSVGIKEDERKEIIRPYVELIGFDLYIVFHQSVYGAFIHLSKNRMLPEDGMSMYEWQNKWPVDGLVSIQRYLSGGSSLTVYMKDQIPQSFPDPAVSEKLKKLAEKIGPIYDGCLRRGGYTEESFKFLETYKGKISVPEDYYRVLIEGR